MKTKNLEKGIVPHASLPQHKPCHNTNDENELI